MKRADIVAVHRSAARNPMRPFAGDSVRMSRSAQSDYIYIYILYILACSFDTCIRQAYFITLSTTSSRNPNESSETKPACKTETRLSWYQSNTVTKLLDVASRYLSYLR